MVPLYVMAGGILAARALGALLGWPPLDEWQGATRAGLALMFAFTAIAHFDRTRPDLVRMVPPRLPRPRLLVTLTGLAEMAGAVGLVVPALRVAAAWGLMALLVAVFPANVHAARTAHRIGGRPHTPFPLRTAYQILWIWLLWWSME